VFIKQIELAIETKKPLMVHCRQAFDDLIHILNTPGVIHFFTGTKEDAKKLLDMGFSFSFGGVITFARDYDEVIRYIPIEHILLETDAPYVTPVPHRGKRNEPMYVMEVAKKTAEIKGLSFEEICATTSENARKMFRL
jgi:TatD DNase family protein